MLLMGDIQLSGCNVYTNSVWYINQIMSSTQSVPQKSLHKELSQIKQDMVMMVVELGPIFSVTIKAVLTKAFMLPKPVMILETTPPMELPMLHSTNVIHDHDSFGGN